MLFWAFALLAVGIITAGYVYFRGYKAKYRVEVERQLSSVAELKVGELVQYRKERFADGSILFRNAVFSALVQRVFDDPADGEARAQLRVWLSKYRAHYQYDRVSLLDAQGATRLSHSRIAGADRFGGGAGRGRSPTIGRYGLSGFLSG